MNAMLCDKVPEDLSVIREYRIRNAIDCVTDEKMEFHPAEGERRFRVALVDYGAKANILRSLMKRGCDVTVYPCTTPAEEILAGGYDGVMLSNGPGDPAENVFEIEQIGKMFGQVPIFGICLGHQLMALSQGASTVKLKYGHRGGNQPARDTASGRTYITSQNHGYAVVSESVRNGRVSFENANDGTCEGIDYDDADAFSVQFHPEACAGPRDTAFLFDRFCAMMGGKRNAT
jgi:carbamoyl-phosphate synthase small subunit